MEARELLPRVFTLAKIILPMIPLLGGPSRRVSATMGVHNPSGIFSVTLSLKSPIDSGFWPAVSWYFSPVESGLSSDFQIYC